MKKKFLLAFSMAVLFVCMLAVSVSAAAPVPQKPDIGVDFGEVSYIDGFVAPSELYVDTTERVLLTDGNGAYVTYPTYYVTKDSTTFDFDFSKLNGAQSVEYTKKSVVMLEIPNGVTTISNSYFAGTGNFPICVSVQIPGSVTTYGTYMFQTNTVIRIVEFLDGTEPVTMGDGMFGSNWSVGTKNLEYVRLPNNLTSIGNGTFGKSYANKTVILGENLQSIGTGFFGESTPDNKDTFIYVSDNFFKNTELFSNLFGGYDQYHNSLLRITLFYTGSQEQAQALVDKGLAVQTGYIWSNVKMVSASEYDYDTHKPARNSLTLAYDFSKCDAFYGGHSCSGEEKVISTDYFKPVEIGDTCINCGLGQVVSSFSPIFEWKGYSYTEKAIDGKLSMTQGYFINKESIIKYMEYTGKDFKYGFVISSVENPIESEYVGTNKVIIAEQNFFIYNYAQVKVSGITLETSTVGVVFCMYVNDGGDTYYLDKGETSKTASLKSYNDIVSSLS